MDHGTLDARAREILKSVIAHYILTGEPVGSRTIAKMNWEGLSPASIRNVMADLEEMGFLAQPHTSAGRVPTESAFRLYVDAILDQSVSDSTLLEGALGREGALAEGSHATDELLRRAADLLSRATGQLGFFIAAQPDRMLLRHVVFVRVSSSV